MNKLSSNIAYTLIIQLSGIIFTFISIPYVNKILGVEHVGEFEFLNSIIINFIILSGIGVPMYGMIRVSKLKDSNSDLNALLLEMCSILLISSCISFLGLVYIINTPFFNSYSKNLFYVLSCSIFLNNFGLEWYFQGMEKQSFIAKRQIIVKTLALILLFLFVKSKDDLLNYGIVYVFATFGANLINILYLKGKIDLNKELFKKINLKKHLKPLSTLFFATIVINLYVQFDLLILGKFCGKYAVGYYSTAYKLIKYSTILVLSINAVIIARLSYLIQNDKNMYYDFLKRSINYIFLVTIPITCFFFIFAEQIIFLISDSSYFPSIIVLKILSPQVIIISLLNALVFYVLYIKDKEKILTISVTVSAIFSLIFNYIFTKSYMQNSTAIISVISESIALLIVYLYIQFNYPKVKIFTFNFIKIIISSCLISITLILYRHTIENYIVCLIVSIVSSLFLYPCFLYIFKEKLTITLFFYIRNYIR